MKTSLILLAGVIFGLTQMSLGQTNVPQSPTQPSFDMLRDRQDPIIMQAGSIIVRQSDIASASIEVPYSQVTHPDKKAWKDLSNDETFDQVMQQAELIARAFNESKVTGIYRVRLLVSPDEYSSWKQYQRDLSKLFEAHLQRQVEIQGDQLEVFIEKTLLGGATSETDVIAEVDQKTGKAPESKGKMVDLRLRRQDGEIKAVANLLDRNFTHNSRTTVSYLEGKKNDQLRLRNHFEVGKTYFGKDITHMEVRCDLARIRHSSGHFVNIHPTIRYETKAGCQLNMTFW